MAQRSYRSLFNFLSAPPIGGTRLLALALWPLVLGAAYWVGGEITLLIAAVALPVLALGLINLFAQRSWTLLHLGQTARTRFERLLDAVLASATSNHEQTACFLVEVDDAPQLLARHGHEASVDISKQCAKRLQSALRGTDYLLDLKLFQFGIVLSPVKRLDLDAALHLSSRLQTITEEPIRLGAAPLYVTISIGFCLGAHSPGPTGRDMALATRRALQEARAHGAGSIRAFTPGVSKPASPLPLTAHDAIEALENGQVQPWFQPQICCKTGHLSGLEALARWQHPRQGLITPGDFLADLRQNDKSEALVDAILRTALQALQIWDRNGLNVPHISVNFSESDLRNPYAAEKIAWELDRFNLQPNRLCIEVLENVVADNIDDIICQNLRELSDLGCLIDLDDFGTGHAAISTIQRFSVNRLKIDRSFTAKIERDPNQQSMVAAMIVMARELEVETVAEGVETEKSRHLLTILGCDHLQGYHIARPMPFEQTGNWIRSTFKASTSPPAQLKKHTET